MKPNRILLITIVLIGIYGKSYAQQTDIGSGNFVVKSPQSKVIDSIKMKIIESLVDSIKLRKTLQKISIDSVLFSSKFNDTQELYKMDIFYRNDEMVSISLHPYHKPFVLGISSSNIDFFLDKNKLIFVEETFVDNGSPRLCGLMYKQNQFYYFEDTLINKVTNSCNHTCCRSFIDTDWLIGIFNKAYKVSTKKFA